MANDRPVTYTERISVALMHEHREALRKYAEEHQTAIGIVLREAALKYIGRADLSLAKQTAYPVDAHLKRKRSKPATRHGARAVVVCTKQQRRALEFYATTRGWTVSHLIRLAGLLAVGVEPPKPSRMGRPLGH